MNERWFTQGDPCPTCQSTYGERQTDRPDRCGRCITGLSLSGRAIQPQAGPDGSMFCPMCASRGATCALVPHDEWPDAWQHDIRFEDDPA